MRLHGFESKSRLIIVPVHNTFSKRDQYNRKYIERNAPWHFTLEFLTADGTYRNAHVYTDIEVKKNKLGEQVPIAKGLTKLGGSIKENPETFGDQDHPSAKRFATLSSVVRFSASKITFKI